MFVFFSHQSLCRYVSSVVFIMSLIVTRLTEGYPRNPCGDEGVISWIKDRFGEQCSKKWIINNFSGLEYELKTKLHGQHLATRMVATSIRGHLENDNPPKALSLSLHGSTGIGKTFVSEMIARNLYKKGMESKFVKRFYGQTDFPDSRYIEHYRDVPLVNGRFITCSPGWTTLNHDYADWLPRQDGLDERKHTIRSALASCANDCCQCLFIFDEIDKMPPGIFDELKGYFDHYSTFHGVSYRRSIFLFVSNIGSNRLAEFLLKNWESGNPRESLGLKEAESYLREAVFNTDGGLKYSALIVHNLLGTFVPFLPLQRDHVKQCIRDLGGYRRASEDLVNRVADSIAYFPDDRPVFAKTGCTSVLEKLYQHDEF